MPSNSAPKMESRPMLHTETETLVNKNGLCSSELGPASLLVKWATPRNKKNPTQPNKTRRRRIERLQSGTSQFNKNLSHLPILHLLLREIPRKMTKPTRKFYIQRCTTMRLEQLGRWWDESLANSGARGRNRRRRR